MDPARRITQAISTGVPLFNGGDADGCARVYADTVLALCHSVPSMAPVLQVALDKAMSTRSPSDRAWVLRRALDAVLHELHHRSTWTTTTTTADEPAATTASKEEGGTTSDDSAATPAANEVVGTATRSMVDVGALQWAAVDDRVMGGSSRSALRRYADGESSFEGTLVVANGGFASVRAPLPPSVARSWDSSSGLVLTCAGDGRSGYKVCLKGDGGVDGIMYQASLPVISTDRDLTAVRLPWSAFKATFRGKPVLDAPPIRGERVQQLGFMLSRFHSASGVVLADVPPGRFQLRVERVGSY
jgi:NADH dehydrogenase [ubiquinone] 1 alpha subcomplex assembly factor 1